MEPRRTHPARRGCTHSRLHYPASSPRCCTPSSTLRRNPTTTPRSHEMPQWVRVSVSVWARGWALMWVWVWAVLCISLPQQHNPSSPHLELDTSHQRCDESSYNPLRSPCTPHCTRCMEVAQCTHLVRRGWSHKRLLPYPAASQRCCTLSCTPNHIPTKTPYSPPVSLLAQVSVPKWARV
jgi:hypothetical protein